LIIKLADVSLQSFRFKSAVEWFYEIALRDDFKKVSYFSFKNLDVLKKPCTFAAASEGRGEKQD
jgi:hypothetical protein